jgi:hypothetical protein
LRGLQQGGWSAGRAEAWEYAVAVAKILAIAFLVISLGVGFSGGYALDATAWVYIVLMSATAVVLAVDFWRGPQIIINVADLQEHPGGRVEKGSSYRAMPSNGDPRVGARILMYGHEVMVIGPSKQRPSCYVVVCMSGDLAGSQWLADKGWVTRKCRRAGLLPDGRS